MEQWKLEQLAAYLTGLRAEALPQPVIRQAKLCLLDVLECCANAPWDHRLRGALGSVRSRAVPGGATVWGENFCLHGGDAAFVNAVRGAASYRNDLHRKSASHGGAIVCAAALAAAEEENVSPARALCGIVAGYESMLRLGQVLTAAGLPKGYRSSAISAPIGAAAAAAVTMGLSARELVSAVSFACQSAAGNNEWASAGTGEDVFHAGWGARNGLEAALLAAAGAKGCISGLEGENGLLACLNARSHAPLLVDGLGERYAILEVEFKAEEACLMLQAPCQAAARLRTEGSFRPEEIVSLEIAVAAQAKNQPGCDGDLVENCVQAKMNLRYAVARTLAGEAGWQPPSPAVRRLMDCAVVVEEPAFTAVFPERTPARVRVTTRSGSWETSVPDFTPLTAETVEARFLSGCGRWLGPEKAASIREAVRRMETLPEIRQLTGLLQKAAEDESDLV